MPKVSVVYCKDCMFCDKGENICESWMDCTMHRISVYDDFFCRDGMTKKEYDKIHKEGDPLDDGLYY